MYIPNKKKHVRHTQKKGIKKTNLSYRPKPKSTNWNIRHFRDNRAFEQRECTFLSLIFIRIPPHKRSVYMLLLCFFLIRFIRFLHFSPIFFWAHLKWPVCTINRSCWTFVWHRILCLSLPCLAMACNFEANIDAYKVFLGSLYTISRIYIAHRIQYKSVVVVGPWCICGSLVFFLVHCKHVYACFGLLDFFWFLLIFWVCHRLLSSTHNSYSYYIFCILIFIGVYFQYAVRFFTHI